MLTWSDVWKILFGATFGFMLGLVAEPLKSGIQLWVAKRRITKIIADEINGLALSFDMFLGPRANSPRPAGRLFGKPTFTTDRYDYIRQKELGVYYHLAGSDSLTFFYDAIKEVTPDMAPLTVDQVRYLHYQFVLLADRVQDGLFGTNLKRCLSRGPFTPLMRLVQKWPHAAAANPDG